MEIQQIKEGQKLTCHISGRLDVNTSPELLDKIKLDGVNELIFDLKDVDYVFSAGLRVFLQFQKYMNFNKGTMKIINTQDSVKEIFEIVGFCNFIDIK